MNNENYDAGEPILSAEQAAAGERMAAMRADPATAAALGRGDPQTLSAYRELLETRHGPGSALGRPAVRPEGKMATQQPHTNPGAASTLAGGPTPAESEALAAAEAEAARDDPYLATVPSDPRQYNFDYSFTHQGQQHDEALDLEFRNLAHQLGMPQSTAARIFDRWNNAAKELNRRGTPLSEQENALNAKIAATQLRSVFGENWMTRIESAKQLIHNLPEQQRERTMDLLVASGLGNDINVIVELTKFAEAKNRQSLRRRGGR